MEFTKVLMIVAVAAVTLAVLNLGAVMFQVGQVRTSGYAPTDIGEANLTIEAAVDINFSRDTVDWGSGAVDTACGNPVCFVNLDTLGTVNGATGGGFSANSDGLMLENIGGADVSVTLIASRNASTMFGTDTTVANSLTWNMTNEQLDSCKTGLAPTTFTDVATVSNGGAATICTNLSNKARYNGENQIRIDLNLTIPASAQAGETGTVLTATGSVI